jgi:hypothetical protein
MRSLGLQQDISSRSEDFSFKKYKGMTAWWVGDTPDKLDKL